MATTNVEIPKGLDWIEVTMSVMTNRSDHDIEFCVNDSLPLSTLKGHILGPNEGVLASDLPSGKIYVKNPYISAIYDTALLVLS